MVTMYKAVFEVGGVRLLRTRVHHCQQPLPVARTRGREAGTTHWWLIPGLEKRLDRGADQEHWPELVRESDCFLTTVSLYPSPYVLFKNRGEPQHFSFPCEIIAMRSPRRSASSMWCVESRMVLPAQEEQEKRKDIRKDTAMNPRINPDWNELQFEMRSTSEKEL